MHEELDSGDEDVVCAPEDWGGLWDYMDTLEMPRVSTMNEVGPDIRIIMIFTCSDPLSTADRLALTLPCALPLAFRVTAKAFTKVSNAVEFTLNKEDHTLGNSLRMCALLPARPPAGSPLDPWSRAPSSTSADTRSSCFTLAVNS